VSDHGGIDLLLCRRIEDAGSTRIQGPLGPLRSKPMIPRAISAILEGRFLGVALKGKK